MGWVHLGWVVLSVVLAVILLVLLFSFTHLDLTTLGRLLLGVPPESFAAIMLLLGFNNFLSGEKWRFIARHLQQDGSAVMPRFLYFAFTSIGVGLGQIVPAQLSLVLSRSLGAHLYGGRALVRGATATVFDYFFDLLVAACVALSSLLIVLLGGGEARWALLVGTIGTAGFLLYGCVARISAATAGLIASRFGGRIGGVCRAIAVSPLLAPEMGRRLLAISVLRFLVLVTMSVISAKAIGADLGVWQLAASLPFAILANALALTPGGLGVTEWAASTVLFALGTSFQASAQWALVNRVLVGAAAVLLGLAGLAAAAAARFYRPSRSA